MGRHFMLIDSDIELTPNKDVEVENGGSCKDPDIAPDKDRVIRGVGGGPLRGDLSETQGYKRHSRDTKS